MASLIHPGAKSRTVTTPYGAVTFYLVDEGTLDPRWVSEGARSWDVPAIKGQKNHAFQADLNGLIRAVGGKKGEGNG